MDLVQIKFDGIQVGNVNVPAQTFKVPEDIETTATSILTAVYDTASELKDSLEANSTLQAKYDALEVEKKELQEIHDSLEKGNPEEMNLAIKARLGLEKTAAIFKLDGAGEMEDGELMKNVIMSQNKDLKLDEKDDVYIKARFDILAEEAENGATGLEQLQALHQTTVPHNDNLEQFASPGQPVPGSREDFMAKSRSAFKTPPGTNALPVVAQQA